MPIKLWVCKNCGGKFKRYHAASLPIPRYCGWKCSHFDLGKRHKAPWLKKINQQPGRNRYVGRKFAWKIREKNLRPGSGKTYAKFFGRHEHRVVMEKMIGRKLRKNEVVHHRDGNKRNNNPTNLELMTRSNHTRFHAINYHQKRKLLKSAL